MREVFFFLFSREWWYLFFLMTAACTLGLNVSRIKRTPEAQTPERQAAGSCLALITLLAFIAIPIYVCFKFNLFAGVFTGIAFYVQYFIIYILVAIFKKPARHDSRSSVSPKRGSSRWSGDRSS